MTRITTGTRQARAAALTLSLLAAAAAAMVFQVYGAADGLDPLDFIRSGLILLSTWWLAWGAAQALLGLTSRPRPAMRSSAPILGRTVVLVPVYNEDPRVTFARVAAMDASLQAIGDRAVVDFAILSDTRSETIAAHETAWFAHLVAERNAEGRMFYRRRAQNTGRKAGNIEDFITTSGAAWDYAVILDADSLMEGATILEMIRRTEADPRLGLLQSLPRVVRARSRFGRAMQFSAGFHSLVFARGQAAMQGDAGPFWGHNAIVRIRAFAESCGLPELPGRPPFGGPILSHDYVEAALLARAGWSVRLDTDLDGSYEEGPENIVDHAKRDRRWCQGNLQHTKVIFAPGLRLWSRFVFFQGIFAYIAPVFWLAFMLASVAAVFLAHPPDYFPQENWPIPVFPVDQRSKAVGLALGIFGLLILPKLAIGVSAIWNGRGPGFGGAALAFRSVLAELVLSTLVAPVLLAFATRSVLQVVRGRDGGWPPNNRGDGSLTLAEAVVAARWITVWGLISLVSAHLLAPALTLWLMPVTLPMIASPLIIALTSRPSRSRTFTVPEERNQPDILRRHDAVLAGWPEAL